MFLDVNAELLLFNAKTKKLFLVVHLVLPELQGIGIGQRSVELDARLLFNPVLAFGHDGVAN